MLVYSIELLPFIALLNEAEDKRVLKARNEKTQKRRNVPVRFPSVNTMYPIHRGRGKYLSTEGFLYKAYLFDCMTKIDENRKSLSGEYFECSYLYLMTEEMFFNKDRTAKSHDVSNFLKATEDGVFEYLCEDDKQVLSIHGHKRPTLGDPKLIIILSVADISNYKIQHGDIVFDAMSFV